MLVRELERRSGQQDPRWIHLLGPVVQETAEPAADDGNDLVGPAHENDGTLNLFGALATSMATTGYATIREFQKAELVMAPSIKTEGKAYQQAQRVGMGH